MIINSVSNSKFKLIKRLRKKKYRDKENLFVIESRKLVDEAISSSADIDFIFLEDGVAYKNKFDEFVFDKNIYLKLTELKAPDGIGAVVRKKKVKDIKSEKVLLLDHINDPGNMGTMIRSAEAFGFSDIILTEACVDIYNEKTLRASMGSIFRTNIKELSLDDIRQMKSSYKILASDMDGIEAKDYKLDSKPIILAIGNEANGLSDEIREMTDDFIKISMQGEIESLNAAIAASIMMNILG
ncbi:RNA methyltransferase [uncultured Anaerococcus sp.]|uniref:TrmH family RNA methyltransferase n=1 Tax=uncultured Anaerococcus sp. TaxID=293428 RepID=UPI00260AF394|nr:RNA methyltransferase [uncultured Anaerococcus sp.]